VKALLGFHPTILSEILTRLLPELEHRRALSLDRRPDRKRRRVDNDGRPRAILPVHKALMALMYLRHNVSHEVVGGLFGWSADASENAFHDVMPALRDLFPKEKWEAVARHRPAETKWTPDAVEYAIIDSFETPIARPSLNERQKRVYSGKKKQHTLKTQVVTDQDGAILDVTSGFRGPEADQNVYRATPLAPDLTNKVKLGDKGYVGTDIRTPTKKPKGGELTAEQREANRRLSAKRIRVEHAIRRIKAFRIVRDEFRLGLGLFAPTVSAVVGLMQFADIIGT
jgi:DDE superfamily endonuclease/Helix-turn-helix of DDE superfamily endonuclease